MRTSPMFFSSLALLLTAGTTASLSAQTFAATTGTEAVITTTPEAHTPHISVPGRHRRAEEKLLFGRVRDGVYTVDGMVAKLKLNYDINGVNYMYMFVPGVGTAVLSLAADPDAVNSEASLKDGELSFHVGDHSFKLTGVALASDKGSVPSHLYAHLDREAWSLNKHPMVGFGNAAATPYVWPGALPGTVTAQAEEPVAIPPVPASLLPSLKPVLPVAAPAAVNPSTLQPVASR